MKLPCDCCDGPKVITPLAVANRPGLNAIRYRVGTHGTFFAAMQARLSSKELPELKALTTREKSDPSLALLDAWATVGDVLTFYQERLANEGYLRTALERRSILEQARLIGYRPRPGVAASTYLAYTLEKDSLPVEIPKGARVNSIPAPGEQMQTFETSDPLEARYEWNALKPRMTRPQAPQTPESVLENGLYLKGTATNLKPNDALVIDFGTDGTEPMTVRIREVKADNEADRTLVALRRWDGGALSPLDDLGGEHHLATKPPKEKPVEIDKSYLDKLRTRPSIPPSSPTKLERSVQKTFSAQAEIFPKLISTLSPRLHSLLYPALRNAKLTEKPQIKAYALRKVTSLQGHNAPKEPQYQHLESELGVDGLKPQREWCEWSIADDEAEDIAYLDAMYDQVIPGSYVVIQRPPFTASDIVIATVDNAVDMSRAVYGITGKVTMLTLNKKWWRPDNTKPSIPDNSSERNNNESTCDYADADSFKTLRATTFYCQSEQLALAEEPIFEEVGGDGIELDGLYEGLEAGRWMIVSGERTDIPGTTNVRAAELVMLAGVTQQTQTRVQSVNGQDSSGSQTIKQHLPGDKLHSFIKLDKRLAYRYSRSTITIYANVVKATHGEVRQEVLGSGDASKPFQSFQLKQAPLTYIAKPTVSGSESTLEVRVNDLKWHEAPDLSALGDRDRKFVTSQDDEGKTTITFGDGKKGARPRTGIENIKSVYRSGMGKPGNVKEGQLALLATRPLGVKAVTNPIRASGGADMEGRDQVRRNAPLALMALDRLVSTADYADFARTFAGVGKAAASRITDGRRQQVQVTIAGAEDIPIDESSDLYQSLRDALHEHGDSNVPLVLKVRERLALVISARVRVHPEYLWEILQPKIEAATISTFSFQNLELGEDLFLADAIRAIQAVPGVMYVDIDTFDTVSEDALLAGFAAPDGASFKLRHRIPIGPTQLAYLSPDVRESLILQEITG